MLRESRHKRQSLFARELKKECSNMLVEDSSSSSQSGQGADDDGISVEMVDEEL